MTVTLGRYGAWLNPVDDDEARTEYAVEAEKLGYGTVWLGLGTRDESELRLVERVLEATEHVTVATAIVNMWTNDATAVAKSFARLADRFPGRFLLGVGVGHPESITGYQSPMQCMETFLDALDAGGVPVGQRIVAALGPKALRLAAARAAGSHPYLVVPDHTKAAREVLGAGPVLAPEQTVVVSTDVAEAREVARDFLSKPYLRLSNYVNNLRKYGYEEADTADRGSDRLVDDVVPHGTPEAVGDRLNRHLDAGADHVAVQVLPQPGQGPMPGLRALARVLL